MAKAKSRPKQWAEAVGQCREALDELDAATTKLEEAASNLRSIQEDYEGWKDNMPENLANSPLGEKLEAVVGLEIENMADAVRSAVDEATGVVDEAEGVDLPRGFGKD